MRLMNGDVYDEEEVAASFICAECGVSLEMENEKAVCPNGHRHIKIKEKGMETLTGKTFEEVYEIFNRQLDDNAYESVPGGAGLTNIKSPYRDEAFNEAFGPIGVGWWYDYNVDDVSINKAGSKWVTSIKRLDLFYRYRGEDGNLHTSEPISYGGSNPMPSSSVGDAIKGAITAALGKASSRLGWQISVYKGERAHNRRTEKKVPDTTGLTNLEAAGMVNDFDGLKNLAVTDSPISLMACRMLMGLIDESEKVSNLSEIVGQKVAAKIRSGYKGLLKKAGDDFASFSKKMFGHSVQEMVISEGRTMWDALVMIANGADREQTIENYCKIAEE